MSIHQSDSSNHPSEVGHRSENNNNYRELPNYLRGYTPGNNRYIKLVMRHYSQHIDEKVGKEPDGPLGHEVKAMNPPKHEKCAGKDDINKFDKWLVQLLAYFWIFKITGLCTDATHVQYTGLYLSELAQQWYRQSGGACTDKACPTLDIQGPDIWPIQEVYPRSLSPKCSDTVRSH